MLLTELLDVYAKKRLRLGSPHTLRLYKHSIAAFEKTLGHPATLADFNDDSVEEHIYAVVQRGLSIASGNKDLAQLTALWRFAHRNRFVDVWPNVRPLKEPERIPMGWMQEDLDKIFAAIQKLEYDISGVPAKLWWTGFLSVLLETGERSGAIRVMAREHLRGSYVFVPAENRKGKTRDRIYPLTPEALATVTAVLRSHREPLAFPWDRSSTYIYKRFSKILELAGLPDGPKNKLHSMRRTSASAVKAQGGDPTAAMDHSSPRTTKRYIDPRIAPDTPTCQLVSQWRQKAIP